MSKAQQRVLMAWDHQFPVTTWERELDNRIAKLMWHHNRYVTGEKTWKLDQKPSREGLSNTLQPKQIDKSIFISLSQASGENKVTN